MPRSTKSKRASAIMADTAPTAGDTQTVTTSTATTDETETDVRTLPFEVNITPAPEDFRPDRSPAGRKRIPSPFEPLLPDLRGKGWQNQPHDGNVKPDENGKYNTLASEPKDEDGNVIGVASVKDSNARVILRELSKAVRFLNSEEGGELNLGLDVNVTAELVQFNVRDKQNRKPRTPSGDEASDGEMVDDTDNGDE